MLLGQLVIILKIKNVTAICSSSDHVNSHFLKTSVFRNLHFKNSPKGCLGLVVPKVIIICVLDVFM